MKFVFLGDSITEGIGSKKINYVTQLQESIGSEHRFINLAKTGTTIKYANTLTKIILEKEPDFIIVMYGSVDAQIRADLSKNRMGICDLIPKRYKIGGMLDPRAFYSHKWYRVIPDHIDNWIRKILKKVVLMTQGKVQWVDIDTFRSQYELFLQNLPKNCSVILLSTVFIDDNYFLGSSIEYEKFNLAIMELSQKYNCKYVDLYNGLKESVSLHGWEMYYSHDHFHPNIEGYRYISGRISEVIQGDYSSYVS